MTFLFMFSIFSPFYIDLLRFDLNQTFFSGRADLAAREREREERVRRLRESQEEDRRRKLEELKQHVSCKEKWFDVNINDL